MIKLQFPPWALFIGVSMIIASAAFIPLVAILRFFGIPRYTKEYPPPIMDTPNHTQQTFIVHNDDAREDSNHNKHWKKSKHSKKHNVESFV